MKLSKFIASSLFGLMVLVPQTAHAGILSNLKDTVKQIVTSPIIVDASANAQADLTQPSLVISSDVNAGAGTVLTLSSNNCLQLNSACPGQSMTDPGDNGNGGGNNNGNGGNGSGGSSSGGNSGSGSGITQSSVSSDPSALTFAGVVSNPALSVSTSNDSGLEILSAQTISTPSKPTHHRVTVQQVQQAASKAGLALATGIMLATLTGVVAKLIKPELTLDTVLWADK